MEQRLNKIIRDFENEIEKRSLKSNFLGIVKLVLFAADLIVCVCVCVCP